jgi:capsule polysaccharide export protein KpsE/RkpR
MSITTATTNALTEDLGVQDVADYVKKYCREGLFDLYKNAPINASLLSKINGSLVNIMDNLSSSNIISGYQNLTVTQDSTEPRRINVTGKIMPAFGLQWMDITFTFVLSFAA